MERGKVIETLKAIRDLSAEFEMYETGEEDVKALDYAIKELEGTAPEVPVQEQYKEFEEYHSSYPDEISITVGLSPIREMGIEGLNKKNHEAVTIKVKIDSSLYNKNEVKKSLKYAFHKILKFYE